MHSLGPKRAMARSMGRELMSSSISLAGVSGLSASAAARSRWEAAITRDCSAVSAASLKSSRPSKHRRSTSMPSGSFISAWWRQVPQGSDQPSTRKVQSPSVAMRTWACQMSRPWGSTWVMSMRRWVPCGAVRITDAFTASWPSRNTFALIRIRSCATAFTG